MAIKATLIFQLKPGEEEMSPPYQVSFNPDTLEVRVGGETKGAKPGVNERQGVNQKAAEQPVVQTGGISIQTVSMQLKLDMVTVYHDFVSKNSKQDKISALVSAFDPTSLLGTAKKSVGVLMTPTDYTQISLFNPTYSCYSLLEQAATHNTAVLFVWGSFKYAGQLAGLNTRFTYFSEQGAPLRADISITLQCSKADKQGEAAAKKAQAQQEAEAKRSPPGGS